MFAIARGLNADGIPTLRGGLWKPAVIGTIIDNPIHGGMIRDGDDLIEARHQASSLEAAGRRLSHGAPPRGEVDLVADHR
jgi:hypothetical protein